MNFPKKLMTKLIIQNNYLFRIFLPSFFHEAYKSKIPQKKTYSKNICVCTVCDNNYIPGLIILIESILEYNYWFNLPFYIFMDSEKKINSKNQHLLTQIYPNFKFIDLGYEFFEIKNNNKNNIRFNRFSQTYLGLYAFNMTNYKTVLSLDTDILCQGDFKPLISDKIEGDIIAVSDAQRSKKSILHFKQQNEKNRFYPVNSNTKNYQVNTGVYILHNKLISNKVYKELFQLAKNGVTNGEQLGGDQEVINYYLEQKKDIILTYAPFIYNTSARTFAGEKFKHLRITNPVFIHYVGNKPWSNKILIYGKLKNIRQLWIKYAQKKLDEIY